MAQIATAATPIPGSGPTLPSRIAILTAAFIAEKMFLNTFVDFERAQSARGFGTVVRVAQHWGFRFLVAFAAALALFAYVRGSKTFKAAAASFRAAPVRIGWMFGHLALVAALAPLSYVLFRYTASGPSFAVVVGLWIVVAAAAALAALLAASTWSHWVHAARALGMTWWYAAAAAFLGTGLMHWAQSLWAPTAALTFDLVWGLMAPFMPTLSANSATLVLSTNRFAVQIADVCSGLEGVGLMLAFSSTWLLCFRKEYIFPRAFLLIPASLATIFGLNVLRIAALILIGNAGFPDVAQYGFHSQAGWIAFITVACGLVLLSRRSSWLNRSALPSAALATTHNPTAAYLMPLLAILGAGAVSRAMSSDFEYFYFLRVIGGTLMLVHYRRQLATIDWRCSWRGLSVGVLVFIIWVIAAHILLPAAAMPAKLAMMSSAPRGFWIADRIVGSVLVVPVAEELAYRGYLMRRLMSTDFESISYRSVRWVALAVTALVFGLAHGTLWLPGIVAGLAFGFVLVRRGRMGEAVAAHATANALISACVLYANQWQLW